jgi:hypothetical protein
MLPRLVEGHAKEEECREGTAFAGTDLEPLEEEKEMSFPHTGIRRKTANSYTIRTDLGTNPVLSAHGIHV